MRRREQEIKSYLHGKIINLKEDIIQGQHLSAFKRNLMIQAIAKCEPDNQWSLSVAGKVQGETTDFMSLFEKVRVTFEDTTSYQPVELSGKEGDGFQIKRGFQDTLFTIRVHLYLESSPKQLVVSKELRSVLGIEQETRARIVSALWQYIKTNRLQDAEDRRIIHLNTELKTVFGNDVEHIEFSQIVALIKPHLAEPKPLEICMGIRKGMDVSKSNFIVPITVQA